MTFRYVKSAILLSSSILLVTNVNAVAKEKWINLNTRNFNVIGNADEGDTRKLALKLEQFHYAFSKIFNLPLERSIKTTVIVFRNESSFNPYKTLYNGKPANVAGYFQGGDDENLIVIDSSANQQRPMSVIYHEYAHLLTSNTPRDWPLWLKEGLAELYSSFDVFNGMVLLGLPITRHVTLLRRKTLIPLKDLLTVGRDSPLYNERDRQGSFYAQSWALCHYLMIGDSNAREAQMVEYTTLINKGVESEQAFAQAFKTSLDEQEKRLREYVSRNTYTANTYKVPIIEGDLGFVLNPVSEGQVQYYLGNLLARIGRIDEAEVLLRRAIEMDPQLSGPYEGLGFVAMRRHRFAEALEYFKQATARGSKNHLAHYYYAETLLRQVVGVVMPGAAKQVGEALRTSIRLMPGFAFAHYSLANLALMSDENLEEGLASASIAVKLEPQNKRFALTLAQLQVQAADYPAARKTLEPLLAPDAEPKLKESAESTLKVIEGRLRAASTQQPSTQPENSGGKREASNSNAETLATNPADKVTAPLGQPTLKLARTEIIRGVLVAIECRADNWTLVVNARETQLRFIVRTIASLEFVSQDPTFNGAIRCGPVNKSAFIYFKPLAGQPEFAGEAVAVEFSR